MKKLLSLFLYCGMITLYSGKEALAVKCEAGTYYNTSTKKCTWCSPGTYSKGGNVTACTPCPAGTFTAMNKATSCADCSPGWYSAGGAFSCSLCSAGYISSAKASACTPCAKNTYAAAGSSACKSPCPKHASCPGASYFSCNDGYYPEGEECLKCVENCSACRPSSCYTTGRYGFSITDPYKENDLIIIESHPGWLNIPADIRKYCNNSGSHYSFGTGIDCVFPQNQTWRFMSKESCTKFMKNRNPNEEGVVCRKEEFNVPNGYKLSEVFPTIWYPDCSAGWEFNWDEFIEDWEHWLDSSRPFCLQKMHYTVTDTAGTATDEDAYFERGPISEAIYLQDNVFASCHGTSGYKDNIGTVNCSCGDKRFLGKDRCDAYVKDKYMTLSATCDTVAGTACFGRITCNKVFPDDPKNNEYFLWNEDSKTCSVKVTQYIMDNSMKYPQEYTYNVTSGNAVYDIRDSYNNNAKLECNAKVFPDEDPVRRTVNCYCPKNQFLSMDGCNSYMSTQSGAHTCVYLSDAGMCYQAMIDCPEHSKSCAYRGNYIGAGLDPDALVCRDGYTKEGDKCVLKNAIGSYPEEYGTLTPDNCCVIYPTE